MTEKIKFLNYLQKRLEINSDDLADFLFIDKRTLYNYINFDIDHIPNKVKEKLIIFFQGYEEFYQEDLTINDIYQELQDANQNLIDYIKIKFLDVASIRKKNFVVTNTKEMMKKTNEKRNINSLDDFMKDFQILVEYSNLSKGYLYSIFEIIISKVKDTNDYELLDYINKYHKEEKE